MDFALSDGPIQVTPLRQTLLHRHAGAFTSFEGWVRDHNEGRGVEGLHYEAYTVLAEAEGGRGLVDQPDTALVIIADPAPFEVHQPEPILGLGKPGFGGAGADRDDGARRISDRRRIDVDDARIGRPGGAVQRCRS